MKRIREQIRFALLLIMVVLATCRPSESGFSRDTGTSTGPASVAAVPAGCSVLTISKGDAVFFGGNDDYVESDSYYWVDPGDHDDYGVVWIGRPDNVQQGVNEKGLAYDANGLPRVDANPHSERIPVPGSYTTYPIHILHECATVEEVISWVNMHEWHSYMHDQMHFADASGDAVIISAGPDGEVVFTRKSPGDGFLVSTNFNVASPANGFGYPCWRYSRAQELLDRLVNQAGPITAGDVAGVLDAIHQQGGSSWTIESLVADLPNGLIYVYYFYQFDRPVMLRIEEELANPRAPGPLSRLFPEEVREEAIRRYEGIQAGARRCQSAGVGWLALVIASLILLVALPFGGRRRPAFWVIAGILLGPVALLVRLIVWRCRQSSWAIALPEALGDVMPTVAAFVVTLVTITQVPAAQSPGLLQILLIIGLPTVMGWLIFHSPMLASLTDRGYGRFLGRRLPHILVAANMGMGGISIIAMPLVARTLRTCAIMPLSAWTVITWWAVTGLGAIVGGLLLLIYERWALRGGFRAWSVLASGEGDVRTPSWRELRWYILLSYVVFLGGMAAGAILQQAL